MKITRVFLKPDATKWVDFQRDDNIPLAAAWLQIQSEGFILGTVAVVPRDQIHHIMSFDVGEQQTTLVSFPGGKPN